MCMLARMRIVMLVCRTIVRFMTEKDRGMVLEGRREMLLLDIFFTFAWSGTEDKGVKERGVIHLKCTIR